MQQKIKALETLIHDALARLKKSGEENRKLRGQLERLQEENGALELQLKRLNSLGSKQGRIKARIERMLAKIDKAVSA